jgi:hypothetical protein
MSEVEPMAAVVAADITEAVVEEMVVVEGAGRAMRHP